MMGWYTLVNTIFVAITGLSQTVATLFTATLKYYASKMKQEAKASSLTFSYAGNMLQLVHMCCISKASYINNVPA